MIIAVIYVPLVLLDLSIGVAGWIAVSFVGALSVVSVGPTAALLLIAVTWIGVLSRSSERIVAIFQRERALFICVALLFAWMLVSVLWAATPSVALKELKWWVFALIGFYVVATALPTIRAVQIVLSGFVLGASISVIVGLSANALSTSATAVDTATRVDSRLAGGVGDPNYLAAALVPAACVALGLIASSRRAGLRFLAVIGLVLCISGIVISESRGGILAAVVASLFALVVARRRAPVVAVLAVVLAIAGIFLATSPGAWKRITTADPTGDGRSSLWLVAERMWEQEPVHGVGLGNYQVRARDFVREPGKLTDIGLIAEKPHVTHNVYLQMLAEEGVVGFALLFGAFGLAMVATGSAARTFDRRGSPAYGTLARSVLIGQVGLLTASFFISDADDPRLWALLALGPALRALAERVPVPAPARVAGFPSTLPAIRPA